jgi:uncharacterized membrane protein YeaQ/YmgE (transglycosylase-associated protein family)
MNLVVTLLIGIAIGTMVELLLPGHHFTELVLAMVLGAMGALLARFLGEVTGWYEAHEAPGFLSSVVGAIGALAIYGILFRRGIPRQRR